MTCDEECIRKIVREELANMNTIQQSNQSNIQLDTPRKERKKSTWNIFLADCTKRQPNGTPLGDRTKACSVEYKELKKNGSLDNVISRLSTKVTTEGNNQ